MSPRRKFGKKPSPCPGTESVMRSARNCLRHTPLPLSSGRYIYCLSPAFLPAACSRGLPNSSLHLPASLPCYELLTIYERHHAAEILALKRRHGCQRSRYGLYLRQKVALKERRSGLCGVERSGRKFGQNAVEAVEGYVEVGSDNLVAQTDGLSEELAIEATARKPVPGDI